jgi:aconitate hydratase
MEMRFTPLAPHAPPDLPCTLRILLENVLLAGGDPCPIVSGRSEPIELRPSRIFLHDTNGVPVLVDLAALRDAVAAAGGDPANVDFTLPAELVVDHSINAVVTGRPEALERNIEREYTLNAERYRFLRWGERAFPQLAIVPPGKGIMHQVNVEHLARVVMTTDGVVHAELCLGTDSHTTMVNGLGVLGWGIGGIDAEAALLGEPVSMPVPRVVGVRVSGKLREGTTATDLALTTTDVLRRHDFVGAFVEFFGPGVEALPVADRLTVANMSPEFGSTCAYFPIDDATLRYLSLTGRPEGHLEQIEEHAKTQGLWHDPTLTPRYASIVELDLASVSPSVAGPRRPHERIPLARVKDTVGESPLVIAAITSCTNTSNPAVMVAAGLLARNAVERGLASRPWVKTSLSPGSRVVTGYLERAGLTAYLDALGFHLAGYGCMTCIGASGPLPQPVPANAVAVLSGNRNFDGRIHPDVRASYLVSPPLVVAYALAGRMDVDLEREPLQADVYLRDIWPSSEAIHAVIDRTLGRDLFERAYADVFAGDARWNRLDAPAGATFSWADESTYLRRPPYLDGLAAAPPAVAGITGARVLAKLGDAVSTDHISPAGAIPPDSVAGRYLLDLGVERRALDTYASRRGNHEVMTRGTFANLRLRNELLDGDEGGLTRDFTAGGRTASIFDAAAHYRAAGIPQLVLAGEGYGSGSSRDWAAKGPALLGVRAVLARSFERIHRANLVAMGVLPLELPPGEGLGLTGEESVDLAGIGEGPEVTVTAGGREFPAIARLETPRERLVYAHGGVLPLAARTFVRSGTGHVAAVRL